MYSISMIKLSFQKKFVVFIFILIIIIFHILYTGLFKITTQIYFILSSNYVLKIISDNTTLL